MFDGDLYMSFLAPRCHPFNTLNMQNTILSIVHHSTFIMALMRRTCLNNETPLCLFLFCAFLGAQNGTRETTEKAARLHLVA